MHWKKIMLSAILVLFAIVGYCQPRTYYVSPGGSDKNSGTISNPFASLKKACDEVAALKKSNNGNLKGAVTIYLRAGNYRIEETLRLDSTISGTSTFPITFSAYNNEKVILNGGLQIPVSAAKLVYDQDALERIRPEVRNRIYQVDLNQYDAKDLGVMHSHGFRRPYYPATMELFVNSGSMKLARYPNDSMMLIGHLVDAGSIPVSGDFSNRGGLFNYTNKRISSWTTAKDAWMGGFFNWGYADDEVPLQKIDTNHLIVYSDGPTLFGFSFGKDFRRWYVYNLLEELDVPGEYYIDREKGMLYFIPPISSLSSLEVSMLEDPMVSLLGCSNVIIKGISFENTRGIVVYLEQGESNKLENCSFRNIGSVAVVFGKGIEPFKELKHNGTGLPASEMVGSLYEHLYDNPAYNREAGKNNGIVNCVFSGIGMGAISLGGGNRRTLTPAGNYVYNCDISNFNRLGISYKGAVNIDGVGNIIRNCHIHDAPHTAILLHGNNHIIEYNEINDVCREAEDMGAFYMGRDPSEVGNILRYNYFHDILPKKNNFNIAAVYFDDGSILNSVTGNIFYKCGSKVFGALFVHGGFAQTITNNIFIDCSLAAGTAQWDSTGWANYLYGELWKHRLYEAVNILGEPYSTTYSTLSNLIKGRSRVLKASGNYIARCDKSFATGYLQEKNWITDDVRSFVDYKTRNFSLVSNAEVFKKVSGFDSIPFAKIGRLKNYIAFDSR